MVIVLKLIVLMHYLGITMLARDALLRHCRKQMLDSLGYTFVCSYVLSTFGLAILLSPDWLKFLYGNIVVPLDSHLVCYVCIAVW